MLSITFFSACISLSVRVQIVTDCPKQRFKLIRHPATGAVLIRANQGHTMRSVDAEKLLTRLTPGDVDTYPYVVHGTTARAWPMIQKTGLNKMARNHIHFAIGLPDDAGVISGMRGSSAVLVELDLAAVLAAGNIPMYISDNKVILSPGADGSGGSIPPQYFKSATNRQTGANLLDGGGGGGGGGGSVAAAAGGSCGSKRSSREASAAACAPGPSPSRDAAAIVATLTQKAAAELAAAAELLQTCPFASETDRAAFSEVTAPTAGAGAGGTLTPEQIKEFGQRGTRKELLLNSVGANVRAVLNEVLRLQKSAKKATAKAAKIISKASSNRQPQKQQNPKSKAGAALSALSAGSSGGGGGGSSGAAARCGPRTGTGSGIGAAGAVRSAGGTGFDYLCVLDFEATCQEGKRLANQEVIEFPSVLIDGKTGAVVGTFEQYVAPVCNPTLTEFCSELTGITQSMVSEDNGALPFAAAIARHRSWLMSHGLNTDTDQLVRAVGHTAIDDAGAAGAAGAAAPFGLVIEVGGAKRGCKPTLLLDTARCIDVQQLPNPHSTIKAGGLDENLEAIEGWIVRRQGGGPALLQKYVEEGVQEILAGRSFRVQCFGGRHRSQVVARAVERRAATILHGNGGKGGASMAAVTVVLRDAPPTAATGGKTFAFVTCGDWDLKTMLPAQLALIGRAKPPTAFRRWINIKQAFKSVYSTGARGMVSVSESWKHLTTSLCADQYLTFLPRICSRNTDGGGSTQRRPMHPTRDIFRGAVACRCWLFLMTCALLMTSLHSKAGMLTTLKMDLEGRHHSGIDDCKNIGRIAKRMLEDGWRPALTY